MGIWSWDIIGCDANLELAMDLLTEAGIGPENYATRRKTFMVLVCEHPLQDGRTGMWLGRHNPEEYVEFFSCLDASATQHKALDGALQGMIKLANSVQTVFEVGKDGGCPVGHAFQVLGLILMQAGAMPPAIADVLLSMPLCAASNPGAHNEREEHENRFKDAIREYKSRGMKPSSTRAWTPPAFQAKKAHHTSASASSHSPSSAESPSSTARAAGPTRCITATRGTCQRRSPEFRSSAARR